MRKEPPCTHYDQMIGTITAGDPRTGPHCGVATCGRCITRSAAFVEKQTGVAADPFLSYEEARGQIPLIGLDL